MDVLDVFFALLYGGSFIWVFYLKSKIERERSETEFDNRVLGVIDGLNFAGIEFGCSVDEMRSYVKEQLTKAHSLPGNQSLIEYTAADGYVYYSHTGSNDYMLFAILCIAQYTSKPECLSWCESNLILARKYR